MKIIFIFFSYLFLFRTHKFSVDSMITLIVPMFFVAYLYDCLKMKKDVDRRRLFLCEWLLPNALKITGYDDSMR